MRMPEWDLCGDLRNAAGPEMDPSLVCSASNAQLRLYVAGYMLGDGTKEGDIAAMRRAKSLYDGCGQDLLDRPGRLTTEAIVAEVLMLTTPRAEGGK
jgi:hypothetical protein